MIKRHFEIVTRVTGLLVVTGVGGLLSNHGDGWVGSAYAQEADSQEDSADASGMDEPGAEQADGGESMEESASADDDTAVEEEASEPVEESGAADDSEGTASEEDASAEPAAEEPAQPDPVTEAADEVQASPSPQEAPQSQNVSNTDRVRQVLIESIKEIVPGLDAHAFADSDRLVDLGANSVDRAEIAMLAQERLGLSISRVELFGPKNLGELIALFKSKM